MLSNNGLTFFKNNYLSVFISFESLTIGTVTILLHFVQLLTLLENWNHALNS